jgi:DNA-nicking Smr family endonuclease
LTGEEELFRQAMSGVTPLTPDGRITRPPASPRPFRQIPQPPADIADTLRDPHDTAHAADEFLRNGLSRITLRKLRRGQFPVEDELDLHGLSVEEARLLLQTFLAHAAHQPLRCVNIIHGKGRTPDGRDGLLKRHTRHWLSQHPQVLAWCEPAAMHGGGGAVWVLLRRRGVTE